MKHFNEIPSLLAQQSARHLRRQRAVLASAQCVTPVINGCKVLSFCSNDYLGLANDPAIAAAMQAAIECYGVGAGASHLINGHHLEHEALEQALATFCQREAALVFSNGYLANLGVIAALMGRKDSIIQDKLNHASLIDGARLAQAAMLRYRHNDMAHLEQTLARADGKKLVITDGVFSMDGDCAALPELAELSTRYDAWLMVDDAHGFGVLGPQGAGLVAQHQLSSQQVPVLVGTLGKAFGTSGAFVAGDRMTIDYLLQFCRTYTYTTATPPAIAAATRQALELVMAADDRRTHLRRLIEHLRAGISALGFTLMPSTTPIQPILVGTSERAMQLSAALREHGILVVAIRPPTVPEGSARLRITLSATHSLAQVDQLLNALEAVR